MGITVDSGHGFVLAKVVGPDGSPMRWSAPLFITITGGGVGGTVGMAEVNTCVVLTTPDAVQRFGHASSDWGPGMSAAVGKGGRQYSTACLLARCAAPCDTLLGLSGCRLCHCVWPGMCARQCAVAPAFAAPLAKLQHALSCRCCTTHMTRLPTWVAAPSPLQWRDTPACLAQNLLSLRTPGPTPHARASLSTFPTRVGCALCAQPGPVQGGVQAW